MTTAADILPSFPDRAARSRPMATPRTARPRYGRRRRSMAREVGMSAASPWQQHLRALWDAHAIKAGMIGFYGWFAVANWSRVQTLLGWGG